jgi:hypothetical protein
VPVNRVNATGAAVGVGGAGDVVDAAVVVDDGTGVGGAIVELAVLLEGGADVRGDVVDAAVVLDDGTGVGGAVVELAVLLEGGADVDVVRRRWTQIRLEQGKSDLAAEHGKQNQARSLNLSRSIRIRSRSLLKRYRGRYRQGEARKIGKSIGRWSPSTTRGQEI